MVQNMQQAVGGSKMNNYSILYLMMKDLPTLREYLYRKGITKMPKDIREDIEKLRSSMIVRERVGQ